MARQKQQFKKGDNAIIKDEGFKVTILRCILDETGMWYYEVEPIDFKAPFTREVAQNRLSKI